MLLNDPERLDIASGITRTPRTAPKGMEKEDELVCPYLCLQHLVCSTSLPGYFHCCRLVGMKWTEGKEKIAE